jgi:hypothetical protein
MTAYWFHVLDEKAPLTYNNPIFKRLEAAAVRKDNSISDTKRCRHTFYSVLLSINRMCGGNKQCQG